MRITDHKQIMTSEVELENWSLASEGPVAHRTYHEMADRPVVEMDAVAQLEANVILLENLQGRLSFMMREVRGLLKA